MNATEADDVIRRIANRWGHQYTGDQEVAWRQTLAPVPYGLGLAALDRLSRESAPPSYRRLLEVVQELAAAHPAGGPPRPRRNCPLCGGNGWREAEVEGGESVFAVVRCSCWPPAAGKHRSGCTCRECLPEAGNEGPVGEPPRRTHPDRLRYRSTKPAPGSLL